MRLSTRKLNGRGRIAVAVLVGIAVAVLAPGAAQAATTTFHKESRWATGYVGRMAVHNDGGTPLSAWRVEFELPAGTTIGHHWNATLSRAGTRYVFTNLSWNGRLEPGSTTSFGFVADGTGDPIGCTVNGAPCTPDPDPGIDIRPPSTPTNLRLSLGGGAGGLTVVSWDAATDNRGVTGYELFMNGRLLASTTDTSHTMPTPPPMAFTLAVRAVDAAGNLSPFAVLPMPGRVDTTPPSAPTQLSIGSGGSTLSVRWTASQDDVMVAGYRVHLNGALISLVGGTSARVPYGGFGEYLVTVYAFDGAGNQSAGTTVGIAIDPPPPPPALPALTGYPPPSPGAA